MANQEILLQIKDLSKSFKVGSRKLGAPAQQLHALSHVDLEVYRGETLALWDCTPPPLESWCLKAVLSASAVPRAKSCAGKSR